MPVRTLSLVLSALLFTGCSAWARRDRIAVSSVVEEQSTVEAQSTVEEEAVGRLVVTPVAEHQQRTAERAVVSEVDRRRSIESFRLGQEYRADGDRRQALEALENAYRLGGGDAETVESLVSLRKEIGLQLYADGNVSEAIRHWRRALEIHPGDEEAQRFLERALSVERRRR